MNQEQPISANLWVDHYGDYLYRYAYSRLRDANSAEEVVQDTFLAGIRNQHQFAGSGSQRGWLVGILKRKIIDFVRKRTRHRRTTGYDDPDPSAQLFDENDNWRRGGLPFSEGERAVESKELWQVVRQCLDTLPQGQSDVFVLSVMEDMSTAEICNQLEITTSNLWVRLHRARLGLAKCVGAKWFNQEEITSHAE